MFAYHFVHLCRSESFHIALGSQANIPALGPVEDVEVGLPGGLPEGPLRRRLHDGDVLPGAGLGVAHLQPPDKALLVLQCD